MFAMSFHVVIPTTMRHLLQGALRFFSIISTLCLLSSQMFFFGYIELFLTQGKIFICLMASTWTQLVSTIYIVVTKAPFFGHYACFKILHLLNFHTFHASIFQWFVTFSPVMGIYFLLLIGSNSYFIFLGIRPLYWGSWLVDLFCYFVWGFVLNFMDSSIVFVCCGFIHCFRADSSTLLTGDSSPLF